MSIFTKALDLTGLGGGMGEVMVQAGSLLVIDRRMKKKENWREEPTL